MQHLPQYLLLFHGLFPVLATVLVWCLVSGERAAVRCSLGAGMVGVVSGAFLLACLTGWIGALGGVPLDPADSIRDQSEIVVSWGIPLPPGARPLLSELTWRFHSFNASLLLLLPWGHVTAMLLGSAFRRTDLSALPVRPGQDAGAGRVCLGLGSYAAFNLALLASDWSSLFTGLFLTAGLLAASMAFFGRKEKRETARSFMTVQLVGLLLLVGGSGMLIASAAVVRAVPEGPPGDAPGSMLQLQEVSQSFLKGHPAAEFVWSQYVTLPIFLLSLGAAVSAGLFPLHPWLARTMSAADLSGRLRIVFWTKGILLVATSAISAAGANGSGQFALWWVLPLAVGCLYSSLLLLGDEDPPHMQASALLWSNQLWLLMLVLTGDTGMSLSLMIPHTAGLVLLVVALSHAEEQRLRRDDGTLPAGETTWLMPCLVTATVALSLIPGLVGLAVLWTMTRQLAQVSLWGAGGHLLLLFVALLALSGLLRMMFRVLSVQQGTGTASVSLLNERETGHTSQMRLTGPQRGMLFLWAAAAWIGSLIPLAR